jgi:hypothetical protein
MPICNLRGNRVWDYSYHFGFVKFNYQEKALRPRYTRGYSMALSLQVLTQPPEYQFHYTNMLHETQQMDEDSELDGLITVPAYKVIAILVRCFLRLVLKLWLGTG